VDLGGGTFSSMEADLSYPPSGALAQLVRELCISTGLPFGEVWVRPRSLVIPTDTTNLTRNGVPASEGPAATLRDRSYHGERALLKGKRLFGGSQPRDFSWHGEMKKTLRSLTGGMLAVNPTQFSSPTPPTDFSPVALEGGEERGHANFKLVQGSSPPNPRPPPPAAMDPSPTVCYSANDTSNGASNGAIGARKVTEVPASPEITQTAGILGGIQAQDGTPDGPPLSRSPSQEAGVERWRDGSTHSTSRVQRAGSGGGAVSKLGNGGEGEKKRDTGGKLGGRRGSGERIGARGLGSPLNALRRQKSGGEDGGCTFRYEHFLQHSGAFYASPAVMDDPDLKNKVQSFMNVNSRTYLEGQGVEGLAWERGEADFRDLAQAKAGEDPELCSDPRCALVLDAFGGSLSFPIRLNDGQGRQHEHVVGVLVLYTLSFEGLNNTSPGCVSASSRDFARYVQDSLSLAVQLHYAQMEWEKTMASIIVQQPFPKQVSPRSASASSADAQENLSPSPFFVTFFKKMRGQKASPPKPNSAEFCFVTFVGCFLSLLALSGADDALRRHIFNNEEMLLLIGSFGALATLLFAAPVAPLAQPRIVVGGHIISAAVGIIVDYLTNDKFVAIIPQWVANALAPALAITLMAATGLTHPPAGACSLMYISGNARIKSLGWLFIVVPIITGSLMMLGVALLVNNLSKHRKYPLFW